MDTIEAIRKRRSIREYKKGSLAKEILQKLVDAARFAPTARGVEPWEFVVITQTLTLEKIAELAENGRFIASAAACIAVFCQDTKYYLEDGCAATQNILLAATALGVASCWVAGDKKPYSPKINDLLKVPGSLKLVSLISLGYPLLAGSFSVAKKREPEQLTHWERF